MVDRLHLAYWFIHIHFSYLYRLTPLFFLRLLFPFTSILFCFSLRCRDFTAIGNCYAAERWTSWLMCFMLGVDAPFLYFPSPTCSSIIHLLSTSTRLPLLLLSTSSSFACKNSHFPPFLFYMSILILISTTHLAILHHISFSFFLTLPPIPSQP